LKLFRCLIFAVGGKYSSGSGVGEVFKVAYSKYVRPCPKGKSGFSES